MSTKKLTYGIKTIKHLKCTKEMSFNKQFTTKWKESFRKRIGVYIPIINISKLFK